MKKLVSVLSFASYLSLTPVALAADTPVDACADGDFNVLCSLTASSFGNVIGTLIQLIFAIAVIVALLYLIWGGFKWLTSGGDKAGVQQAREHIVAAIIGLVVIFLSYFILNIILNFFGVGDLSNLTLPSIEL